MSNIKFIQESKDKAKLALKARNEDPKLIDRILVLHKDLSSYRRNIEDLRAKKNKLSKEIRTAKNKEEVLKESKTIGDQISVIEKNLNKVSEKYLKIMLYMPNLGIKDLDNKELWEKEKIIFKSKTNKTKSKKPHWEIYRELNLVNFEWGTKVGGSRFITYVGNGAKLRRAIMEYQIDNASKAGYLEVVPPVLAKTQAFQNSGHFPKFKEDVFCIDNWDLALVGTSETAICNFFSNEIIKTDDLPLRFSSTTMNFRSESGSAGKDTRGAIRMHQFTKTELFTFCAKDHEEEELKKMLETSKNILSSLEIPFIVKQLPLNDLGFSAQITYDLEIWMPSSNNYREVSSVSLVGDFQSQRSKIRHRSDVKESTNLCSTLNGTSVAVDRLMASICENYYDPKLKVINIPKKLQKYFKDKTISN